MTQTQGTFPAGLEQAIQGYARLIIEKGCDLRAGQELLLSASIEAAPFVRVLAREAYEHGCKRVTVRWSDEVVGRMAYDYRPAEEFEDFPAWQALLNNSMAASGAAVLTIESSDPEAMKGIDPRKMMTHTIAAHKACKEFYDCLDFGKTIWCIAGAPSAAWARKVFPELDEEAAVAHLWESILHTARADCDDPVAAWEAHDAGFEARKATLNGLGLRELHYTNALGTDIRVGLPEGVVWHGGSGETVDGRRFFPNIPTEEIYTSPHRLQIEGIVYSALPLAHHGNLIEDFWIRFEGGRAVEFDAAAGRDVLASIIETDEGACRLGEVALVPYTSPIRQTGILFYSTLYDENASCHMALGKSFPECVEGGLELTQDELRARGLNDSATHVDFMVGTADLCITGLAADGSTVQIFEDGEWAI